MALSVVGIATLAQHSQESAPQYLYNRFCREYVRLQLKTPPFLASFNTWCVKFSHSDLVSAREEALLSTNFRRVGTFKFPNECQLVDSFAWKGWFPLPIVSISRYEQIWLLKKCNKSHCRNFFACIILCEIHSMLIIKDYVIRSKSPIRALGTQSCSSVMISDFLQSLLSRSVVTCILSTLGWLVGWLAGWLASRNWDFFLRV